MSKTNYKRYYFCILFFIVLFISLIYAALHPNFYVFMFPAIITAFFLEGLYYWGVFSKEESESKTKEILSTLAEKRKRFEDLVAYRIMAQEDSEVADLLKELEGLK